MIMDYSFHAKTKYIDMFILPLTFIVLINLITSNLINLINKSHKIHTKDKMVFI